MTLLSCSSLLVGCGELAQVPDATAGTDLPIVNEASQEGFSFEFDLTTQESFIEQLIAKDAEEGEEPFEEADGTETDIDEALALMFEDNASEKIDPAQRIIGRDDRLQVTNTASYPWSAICYLESRWPDGRVTTCSGTLIGPRHVLTAAHCIYDANLRMWTNTVAVVPGKSGNYEPFGRDSAYYMRIYSSNRLGAGDIALLSLRTRMGDRVGWFGYGAVLDSFFTNAALNTAGYPGDRGGATMVAMFGYTARSSGGFVVHWLDTYFGQSGSGMWVDYGRQGRWVVAVHSSECNWSGCSENYAAAITNAVGNWITQSRRQDGG